MVRIKVCGITELEDALCAVELGAWALGFIFYPGSKRYIEPRRAAEIIERVPPFVTTVGVFVNQDRNHILRALDVARFDVCQLHGDEPPSLCRELPVKTIKAFRIGGRLDPAGVEAYPCDAVLFDTAAPGGWGGTGRRFDWTLLRGVPRTRPLILSGGLDPDNVGRAVREVSPYAVDVCSGVEIRPGKKSADKIKRFIEAVNEENSRHAT